MAKSAALHVLSEIHSVICHTQMSPEWSGRIETYWGGEAMGELRFRGMPVKFTPHAVGRILDMTLEGDEVRECIANPESVSPSIKYPGTTNVHRGRICVGVVENEGVQYVKTVVWSTQEAWCADLARGVYGNREVKQWVG
ncbi:hypothetical protein [Nocardia sp. CS682]|uniref:hypothetical protein n=1 Tax=Nocardia sp. CS682 TaxID=1047172 RepID=UPI001074D04B|nr:hypothetical protein [Nocardia sp. CS682]